MDDQRQFGRIQHVISAHAICAQGTLDAEIQSLSKGGAAILAPALRVSLQDRLKLTLEGQDGQTFTLDACVIWLRTQDNPPTIGLRFENLSSETEVGLQELIKAFLNEGNKGGRRHPRIARRVPARYGERDELKAILENISLGGLALIVETPVKPKDEVEIEIQNPSGPPPLVVSGKVVYCHPAGQPGRDAYRVGVEFKTLDEHAQGEIARLLTSLMDLP